MEVAKVRTDEGKIRYYVADNEGDPIEPVLRFIRFKDNTKYARNTLKAYCEHLRLYFEYLSQIDVDFTDITVDHLSLFVNWLQNPYKSLKVNPSKPIDVARSPGTVNSIVGTVLAFYDYLLRHEKYNNHISERVKKFITIPTKRFMWCLHGIAYEKG